MNKISKYTKIYVKLIKKVSPLYAKEINTKLIHKILTAVNKANLIQRSLLLDDHILTILVENLESAI